MIEAASLDKILEKAEAAMESSVAPWTWPMDGESAGEKNAYLDREPGEYAESLPLNQVI